MYNFGDRSWKELRRGHPKLISVAALAITRTPIDFGVHDVARSLTEQQHNVDVGVSWTLDSMHRLRDPDTGKLADDGVSFAMDLVPYIHGRMRWEWGPIFTMAEQIRRAARDLLVPLVWGGVWDTPLLDMAGDLKSEHEKYIARRLQAGKSVHVDGPHFQLVV